MDTKCILSISICDEDQEDTMSWKFTPMNEYGVKSGIIISWKISLLMGSIRWMKIAESCGE